MYLLIHFSTLLSIILLHLDSRDNTYSISAILTTFIVVNVINRFYYSLVKKLHSCCFLI